jgi:uncharacterized membrane protein YoaK (UPF0700 family)
MRENSTEKRAPEPDPLEQRDVLRVAVNVIAGCAGGLIHGRAGMPSASAASATFDAVDETAQLSVERWRDLLLILLGVSTGAIDATAFERLGHVFASVITGNLILVGVSAARGDGQLALFAGCALCGYALGVLAAAPRADQPKRVWPPSATVALVLELGLLLAFTVGWELIGERPGEAEQLLLLVAVAAAMGVQSTAVRRLGSMSTTYLTSTLTGLLESLRQRRWSEGDGRSLGILGAAVAGAAGATGLILHARRWLPALALAPLVIVVLDSRRLIRQESA